MLIQNQVHVVDGHDWLELLCDFYMENFDLFHNPVIWTKIQMGEKSHINIMGNIQEPFVETGRFKVALLQSVPRYRLTLQIEGRCARDLMVLLVEWLDRRAPWCRSQHITKALESARGIGPIKASPRSRGRDVMGEMETGKEEEASAAGCFKEMMTRLVDSFWYWLGLDSVRIVQKQKGAPSWSSSSVLNHILYQCSNLGEGKSEDVRLEDYGNYSCEVRGREAIVLASVTHFVFVRAPVHSIWLSDKGPINVTVDNPSSDPYMTLTEGDYSSVYCVSMGGCPPPDMTLYLGQNEITGLFSLHYSTEMSGLPGFSLDVFIVRQVMYKTERWTDRFSVTAADDEKDLQCIVTVPGLGSSIASIKVRVRYTPVVLCDTTEAAIGESDISIRCQVKSRPGMHTLYWIVDINGTRLDSGESRSEYQTLNMDRGNNVIETRLYITEVYEENFRDYVIVAENAIGKTVHHTRLLKKLKPPAHQSVLQIIEPKSSRDQGQQSHDQTSRPLSASAASRPVYISVTWGVMLLADTLIGGL
ncbi:hypothetical protein LSH36_47g01010 [Paralvinella palmiformis]|uniref:Ig-like domain-containing protein n=1 Tax=Paralvinella palmiformis TaxID=53620 RepID=A0AAD9NFU7_9ANNE|nr:hypothetical protein LSH36_47g01010 [Paralvinella palmiformis]